MQLARPAVLAFGLVVLALPAVRGQGAVTPEVAWQRLKDGNTRFVRGTPWARETSAERRAELARGQEPFGVVLTCADSRVVPEVIFDQHLADLFVLRLAGNVADPGVIGSAEYAAEALHVPLVAVIGHTKCGAIDATLSGKHIPGELGALISRIHVGNDSSAAVQANALFQARELTRRSPVLKELAQSGRIKIVAGVYELDSGIVRWLDLAGGK